MIFKCWSPINEGSCLCLPCAIDWLVTVVLIVISLFVIVNLMDKIKR